MDASKPERQRRWLPPLILLGALMGLGSGVMGGLTAETRGLRLVGWLIAAGRACNTVVAAWLLRWVWSGRGGPPPRIDAKGRRHAAGLEHGGLAGGDHGGLDRLVAVASTPLSRRVDNRAATANQGTAFLVVAPLLLLAPPRSGGATCSQPQERGGPVPLPHRWPAQRSQAPPQPQNGTEQPVASRRQSWEQ